MTGTRIRIIEKCGTQLRDLLKSIPGNTDNSCMIPDCKVCQEEGAHDNPKCDRRSVLYQNQCMRCLDDGKETVYYGETSRTLRERYKEHIDQRNETDSHMRIHEDLDHEGEVCRFQVKMLRTYRSPIERQISEAVKLKLAINKQI